MRDARFHTQIMVGGKEVAPNSNVEHGKEGWALSPGKTPDGERDPDHLWVGHKVYGWTRTHNSNVRYIRYWSPGDEDAKVGTGTPLMDPRVRQVLQERGELPRMSS